MEGLFQWDMNSIENGMKFLYSFWKKFFLRVQEGASEIKNEVSP
jgi:hypothetical protein